MRLHLLLLLFFFFKIFTCGLGAMLILERPKCYCVIFVGSKVFENKHTNTLGFEGETKALKPKHGKYNLHKIKGP